MIITVQERDDEHLSHDAQNSSIRMWNVFQGNELVGVFHSEEDALKYKALLESGRLDQLQPTKNN
jgi:hypothetical protein